MIPITNTESKVRKYHLEEYVMECYLQNINMNRIATLCNKKLQKLKDEKKIEDFVDLSQQNIKSYLESEKKNQELLATPESTSLMQQKAMDVMDELVVQKNLLINELDKLRDPDVAIQDSKQVFFVELIKQMGKLTEISAGLQGKLQPAISVNMLGKNITHLVDKIRAHPDIPADIKVMICDMLANEIINEALLKSVKGIEVNG